MRTAILIACSLAIFVFMVFWLSGVFDTLAAYASNQQREAQNALARGLRALKGGQPGALLAVLGIAFAYGVFHAAGPGHGKMLIGGYGLARPTNARKLAFIALLSSLAQSTTAILLVYAGVFIMNWTREQLTQAAENSFAPLSYAAIALIGIWLAIRGARHLISATQPHTHTGHCGHDHSHGCSHRHGPTPDEIAKLGSWRDALVLIGGIALRPCTGALFLLVITFSMGVPYAGILGAYAMGLGTAIITISVALGAVWFRKGLATALDNTTARFVLPTLELAAGLAVTLMALELLRRVL